MESTTEQGNGVAKGAELVKSEPLTPKGIITKAALDAEREQRTLLAEFIHHNMVEGTDYGTIPGTPKPTLLKPGAEKLTDLFRCTPRFKLMKAIEDFDKGLFSYIFRVQLIQRDAGAVVAEGFGSANSREGRYRWRDAKPKCPNCQKETVFRSKNDGEGFYCWKKKGGCGATFADDDARITEQPAGKVENDDIATLANTILKMAKKRAHVDGAIALGRCSDLFTQDVEDIEEPVGRYSPKVPEQGKRTAPTQASAKTATEKPRRMPIQDETAKPTPTDAQTKASEAQLAARHVARAGNIWKRAQALGMNRDTFAKFCLGALNVQTSSREWTHEQMTKLEDELATAERARGGAEESDAF